MIIIDDGLNSKHVSKKYCKFVEQESNQGLKLEAFVLEIKY